MSQLVMAFFFPLLFPVGTTAPVERRPVATYALMGLMTLVFALELIQPDEIVAQFALWDRPAPYQFLTYALMHAGPLHLLSNLYALWIFGSPVESRMGIGRYLLLFAGAAVAGGLAHIQFSDVAHLGLVGASGAVMGLIGAYMILFPYTSVRCLFVFLIVIFPVIARVTEFPAIFLVILYYVINKALTFYSFGLDDGGNSVSTLCHVGGLLAGAGIAAAFYGFRAFTAEEQDDRVDARQLELRLQNKVRAAGQAGRQREYDTPSQAPRSITAGARKLTQKSAVLAPLLESVVAGDGDQAEAQFLALLDEGHVPCLHPGPQMDLARLMISRQRHDLAIEALEVLIARYPYDEVITVARFELARQLILAGRERGRAMGLLREFIASQPPLDLEREAQTLMQVALQQAAGSAAPAGTTLLGETSLPPQTTPAASEPAPPTADDVFVNIPVAPSTKPIGTTALFNAMDAHAPAPSNEDSQSRNARADALFGNPHDLLQVSEQRPLQIDGDGPMRFRADTHASPVSPEDSNVRRERDAALFGNPDDTSNMPSTALFKPSEPAGGAAPIMPPAPRIPFDTGGLEINLDGSEPAFQRAQATAAEGNGPAPLLGQINIAAWDEVDAHPVNIDRVGADEEAPMPAAARRASEPERQSPIRAATPAQQAAAPPEVQAIDLGHVELELDSEPSAEEPPPARLAERPHVVLDLSSKSHAPSADPVSPEAYAFGISTQYGEQSAVVVQRRDRRALRQGFRLEPGRAYGLLVSPEQPLVWSAIVAVMGPELGLAPDTTQHAMLRRRGVLIEELDPVHAELLARQLVAGGQSVLIAETHPWAELPPALDVLRIQSTAAGMRAQSATRALDFTWDAIELITAGCVTLWPRKPPRVVCDLVLGGSEPCRLRLWENLYWFGRGALGSEREQFHGVVRHIADRAAGALQTRTLMSWLKDSPGEPPHRFASLIEYESLLRWHRLAFFAPQKEYRAE